MADVLSHASLQDGMKLSGASCRFYSHNNMKHLERILKKERDKHSGCLIVTEGIFSMDGTLGKIHEILPIARKYNARVMADQGHCFGLLGERLTGTAEHFGMEDKLDITMGLFSKAAGAFGGFVTGPPELIHWYKVYARSYIFATSIPPGIAAGTLKALEIMESGERQKILFKNIEMFVKGLVDMGLPIDPQHSTPIVPIEVGDETKMGAIFQSLLEGGVYALPVMYPVVARNHCRFRFSITSALTPTDIELALMVLKRAFEQNNFTFKETKREGEDF